MSITTRKTVKDEYLIVVDDNTADKHYFETSADQVIVEDKNNKLNAINVEDALEEIVDKIGNLDTGVTSVNGKTGAVTLGAGDVGAEPAFTKNTAFNKDFGNVAGTVMEGNDSRVTTAVSDISAIKTDISGIKTKNTEQDTAIAGKANLKGGNAFTGDQSVAGSVTTTGNVTVGGNLTVNGTTTTVNSTTLAVTDKLIEVAHGNTVKLPTPAGLVAPKYDGTNSGALVFDGDGIASVGDVVLSADGNIDVTKSNLQPLATRTGLVDGNLVKYDGTNQTLVDTGKKAGDFATAAQGATADAAKAKADTNATDIANIKDGTTVVPKANHAKTADSAAKATTADSATKATTADSATHATSADSATTAEKANRVKGVLTFAGNTNDGTLKNLDFSGSMDRMVNFKQNDFSCTTNAVTNPDLMTFELSTVYTNTEKTQTVAGTYTALQVDAKGRATAGNRAFAVIGATDDIPSDVMVGGFILRAKA